MVMAKNKKKRTKRYTGTDAAQGPVVHKYEAVERSRVGDWWVDNKLKVRIFSVLALIAGILTLIVSGIVTLVT